MDNIAIKVLPLSIQCSRQNANNGDLSEQTKFRIIQLLSALGVIQAF